MATETPLGSEVAGSCVDAGGAAVGLPQLCFEWYGNQIFWLVVTLVVIYFLLSRIALPRISAILAERMGTITNAVANAEDLKAKAAEAEQAYEKALADARAEAQRIAAENREKIQAELDDAIERADAEIAAKAAESEKAIEEIRETAMDNVREVAKDTAEAIVAQFGGKADAKAVNAAVDERMKG